MEIGYGDCDRRCLGESQQQQQQHGTQALGILQLLAGLESVYV